MISENEIKKLALNFLKEKGVKPIYISVSGSHLYGFESKDSDIDIRCCHLQPTKNLLGLSHPREVLEKTFDYKGTEIDIVSLELKKVLGLILANNSNILEQISAKNLHPCKEYNSLKKLSNDSLSKIVFNPYNGMAMQNYKKFIESKNPAYKKVQVKKYLYVLRSLLAGIYALKYKKIQPNLVELNKEFKIPIIHKLTELKREKEKGTVPAINEAEKAIKKLMDSIIKERDKSTLPETPSNRKEINKFLIKTRLENVKL